MALKRIGFHFQGTVQGVGFRPCVYQIAHALELTGWVYNDAQGVFVEIQGQQVEAFLPRLQASLPPLARLDHIEQRTLPIQTDSDDFFIRPSQPGSSTTNLSPDTATCQACLTDLSDNNSHYQNYPFLNCTHCGPRFSIVHSLPYDRCQTSMQPFVLCAKCNQDYTNPNNRRYHAQPTACHQCGPKYEQSIAEMAQGIAQGRILAIKGLGGYQIICDASNPRTLAQLRQRKHRPAKPFAVMVKDIPAAHPFVQVSKTSEALLQSKECPIVLLPKQTSFRDEQIAPNLNELGVLLPYTPMHHILFAELEAITTKNWLLIVTSANVGGEPIIRCDEQAKQQLKEIACQIIPHNRDIVSRVDDSVVRIIDNAPMIVRRARGYVPQPIPLSEDLPPVLALGGHLKNTFCITRGKEAFVSQHIGSLSNRETLRYFDETLARWLDFLQVEPVCIAHDAHPDFYTSQILFNYDIPRIACQHHHAHIASVIAEHQLSTPFLGLALDGFGYGSNGEAWGGELLYLQDGEFERVGHLGLLAQPGGDTATRQPWRMAASVLTALGQAETINSRFGQFNMASGVAKLCQSQLTLPTTSSAGRLFDAAAALLDVCLISTYEGQAAMMLEALVSRPTINRDGWVIEDSTLSFLPLLSELSTISDKVVGANLFHGTLIAGLSAWIEQHCRERQQTKVVLSGGCFLNRVLTEGLMQQLKKQGIKAILPRQVPANDGGLALGQAWLARCEIKTQSSMRF